MIALIVLFILDALCIGSAIYFVWQSTKYNWKQNESDFFTVFSILFTFGAIILFIAIISILIKTAMTI